MVLININRHGKGIFRQYLSTLFGTFCMAIVGTATGWPSPILIKMRNNETPFQLNTTEVSWMVSLLFLGTMFSPVPTAYLMDKVGRRRVLLMFTVLPLMSWILIYFATSPMFLYLARFLAGLWAGVSQTILPVYIGEIAEPKIRGSLSTFNNLLLNGGVLFSYVVGPYVSYHALAAIFAVMTVIYFCMFIIIPESPYYYMMRHREEDAFKSLTWLRGNIASTEIEAELNDISQGLQQQMEHKGGFKEIFRDKGNRKGFIISEVYAVLKRLSGSGVLQAYASVTLPALTFGFLNPDECVVIVGTVSLLSSVGSVFVAAFFNRRHLMTVSCAISGTVMAAVMVWFFLNDKTAIDVKDYNFTTFISFVIFYSTFNFGLGPIGASIKGEMFSANVRALSSSLTTILVSLTSFFLNRFYLIVANSFGMYINYLIFSVSCFAAIAFTWLYVPDTHGKTLKEIQEILHKDKRKTENSRQ
uniref:Major facilitator superfamily (MFS) profile domain-containing protein n=1 Tax=Clastoptera arizonana TaxID=38151 RepID=A0A1B6DZY0_9HEMI